MNTLSRDAKAEETQPSRQSRAPTVVDPDEVKPHPPIDRRAWIAVTAYGMAERRGFEPGHELEDWIKAEKQVQFEIVGEGRTF